MGKLEEIKTSLLKTSHTWLVTGCAGFIGSHLIEFLLKANQKVIGLDNLSTGFMHNIEAAMKEISDSQKNNFRFIKGDICELGTCMDAVKGVDYILHQAALGSVPRSIEKPLDSHLNNVDGTLNIFLATIKSDVKKIVFASSSSVYGDSQELPKVESRVGKPLSPYAATKAINETYADVFSKCYPNFKYAGLRYFNVFGPRQNPNGPYAAVIPRWINAVETNLPIKIFGDGTTARDFTYIENIVQLNILAALSTKIESMNQIYNGAIGGITSLNSLTEYIIKYSNKPNHPIEYSDFRAGDIQFSHANIEKAKELLGYSPMVNIEEGLAKMITT